MSKTTLKFILWIMIILLIGGMFLGSVAGIGRLVNHFNSGADPAAALNIEPNSPLDWPVKVEWLQDDADTGRELDRFSREAVEAAYIRAWLQQEFSYSKGEAFGLETYFDGPALAAVEANIEHVARQGLSVSQVATSHRLKLHFFSADATIVAFTDEAAQVAQYVRDSDGNEILAQEESTSYQVVMMIDEGNWKVRHWLRQEPSHSPIVKNDLHAKATTSIPFAQVKNGQIRLAENQFEIRGINYYPQENSWTDMWSNYEGRTISDDLEIISRMGLNTIRIFVPYELFGKDGVLDGAENHVQQLRDILNEAERHNLKVIVTLFDFKPDYRLLTWPKTDRHLEGLLTTFKDHPAILAWDIKNEPDLDYDSAGEERVNLWLKHTIEQARLYDPNHLITIGWAKAENAGALADEVDFASFHFYAPAEQLPDAIAQLKAEVGPEKPVILGEFGIPTWNSYFFPHGHSESEQYNYYRDILSQLAEEESVGFLTWTLYDFPQVPSNVAGRWPWQRNPQKQMGLIRTDGNPKPAADLLNGALTADIQATSPLRVSVLKPFWQMLLLATGSPLAVLLFFAWRRWKLQLPRPKYTLLAKREVEPHNEFEINLHWPRPLASQVKTSEMLEAIRNGGSNPVIRFSLSQSIPEPELDPRPDEEPPQTQEFDPDDLDHYFTWEE